ncbi:class I SAM-dependent methyltransferase [Arthrobacter pigmenti]
MFAEAEAELLLRAEAPADELAAMIDARTAGYPLEHILGWVEFYGLQVPVSAGVFVPRRRTEFLVHLAATVTAPDAVVLDLCCGCGALGTALSAAAGGIELHASDIEPAAVECARRNVAPLGGRVYEGDLFDPLPGTLRGRIDVLLCNTPYVPTDHIAMMPPEARLHEPAVTLDGGPDGLDVQRRVAAQAADWLAPGGYVLVEAGESQTALASQLFADHGLLPRVESSQKWESTVVIGMRPLGG